MKKHNIQNIKFLGIFYFIQDSLINRVFKYMIRTVVTELFY